MKRIIILVLGCVFALNTYAQDTLILKNRKEILSKVVEITNSQVSYKSWSNIDGPIYKINKKDLSIIKYQNGSKEIFEENFSNLQNASIPNNNLSKIETETSFWRGRTYWQENKMLTSKELEAILRGANKDVEQSLQKYKFNSGMGKGFIILGGGLAISSLLLQDKAETSDNLLLMGAGFGVTGFILMAIGNKRIKTAVSLYNQSLKQASLNNFDLKFGLSQNGIGLSLTF